GGPVERNWNSCVVNDQCDVFEPQMLHQPSKTTGVTARFVVGIVGFIAEPETEVIESDTAVSLFECFDGAAKHERPRHVSVNEYDRAPLPFIEVVHPSFAGVELAES